ncbi:MAG: endonuclease Q family protein [Candidatus Kariarchaeaceae archaeon]|jgi:PHP family Zn ribbon phosphoesterase
MRINFDLHSHSAYAGGALAGGSGKEKERRVRKRFIESSMYSPLKGINLIGTGDCQFEPWLTFLQENIEEVAPGIFAYKHNLDLKSDFLGHHDYQAPQYLLQTEFIFTSPLPNSKRKKKAHVLVLLPDFTRVRELNSLLDTYEVSRKNVARPFIVSESKEQTEEKVHAILDLDPMIEVIPAHVLTPEGVYGGNQRINRMEEFFGTATGRIKAIETGLSADPDILSLIPELDNRTLISNADAHSAALNRLGREFTSIEIGKLSYNSIIDCIRQNKVIHTAEFHPTEGRYFLTGHRGDRKKPGLHDKNQFCCFSPKHVPVDDICPQCEKPLTVGVLQRAYEICQAQGEERKIGHDNERDFVTMIPLVEIIGYSLNIRTLSSKKVLQLYAEIMKISKTEVDLWTKKTVENQLVNSKIPESLIDDIIHIKQGNFCFTPGGFDGTYGILQIGTTLDYENVKIISE